MVVIKMAVGIIAVILQMNVMGKGNLAPNSAFDQVQNFVLGGIIGGIIYNESISVLQFLLVLLAWTILVLIVKTLTTHNRYFKNLVDGTPLKVIERGKVNVGACLQRGIAANDLHLKLRSAGVTHIQDVKRAILEQNGQLTIVRFGEEDIKYPLIVDGRVDLNILDLLDKDEMWLIEELKKQGLSISDVFLAEWVHKELYVVTYNE